MRTPDKIRFEPYKIKMVEPIGIADPLSASAIARRQQTLINAGYNVFSIPAADITIDLLTDSGTGAMSQDQWAAMMLGDEAYAHAASFYRFEESVKEVMSDEFHVIPTHQGRVAENILFRVLNELAADATLNDGKPRRRRVLINSFFDTTAANVCLHGPLKEADHELASDLLGEDSALFRHRNENQQAWHHYEGALKQMVLIQNNQLVVDQSEPELFEEGIFGGNMDLDRLEMLLANRETRRDIMLVMLTTTNNTGGGLPVSMANIRAVRELIDLHAKDDPPWAEGMPPLMFFLDACRFAENAYYIQQHEPGYTDKSVREIAHEMFSYVDGCTMSAKKDGMANMGGFIGCKSDELKLRCWEFMVEIEGFYTYGGLAGRDLEAVAVGLREGVDDLRVAQRVIQVRKLWDMLKSEGVPVKEPCGGHGVFLKGREFWSKDGSPLIASEDLPGHTLAIELFRRYGIRGCEIGTIMFGNYNPDTGKPSRVAPFEDYMRLAVPRRTYTDSHLEYVAASLAELYFTREDTPYKGMQFTYRAPALPHFLSRFKPIKK